MSDVIDTAITALRAQGKTFAQIARAVGISTQAVHRRYERRDRLVPADATTHRLLAALLVQVMRLQRNSLTDDISRLRGLGLSTADVAVAVGTSEASVRTMLSRCLASRDAPNQHSPRPR